MKRGFSLLVMLMVLLLSAATAWGVTVEYRISHSDDDSEERYIDRQIDYLASPDLDLAEKLVGMRFRYVDVPQGATINSAYIEVSADSPTTQTPATPVVIEGEDEDWSRPFTNDWRNISRRHTTSPTVAVDWPIVSNWDNDQLIQTPDLTGIVQEIVDRDGWSMGNPMNFVFSTTGGGHRIIESYDGNPDQAPRLVIDYTPRSCTLDIRIDQSSDDVQDGEEARLADDSLEMCDKWVGLRFRGLPIPQGATITKAYLDLAAGNGDNENDRASVKIWGEDIDNSSSFYYNEEFKDRNRTASNEDWSNIDRWERYGEKHRSVDVSTVVQEIIGRNGWTSGNAMAFLLQEGQRGGNRGRHRHRNWRGGGGKRPLLTYDGDSAAAPLLHVEWDCGTVISPTKPTITLDVASSQELYLGAFTYETFDAASDTLTVTNSGSATLDYTIAGTTGWVDLSQTSGSLAPGESQDITVTYSSAVLALGQYETVLEISDPNASNNPQEIPVSLTVEQMPETNRTCNNVPLYVENRPSPAVLIELDLSGSMDSMMTVAPPGDPPQTPDLATTVQEIVDRSGWQSGNDMSFIFTGSGNRRAYSFDGQSGSAPLLTIGFQNPEGTTGIVSSRVMARRDDAEQRTDGSRFNNNSNDLDLGQDGNQGQVVGLRFQNLDIPQGATITSAVIEFAISAADSNAASLVVKGEATDDAREFRDRSGQRVLDRVTTTASVNWNNLDPWDAPTERRRIDIGKQVISDIVKNRNISWGFGTWTSDFPSSIDYTKVDVGCRTNTDTQQGYLQDAIDAVRAGGRTPFVPSMNAAGKYFNSNKADEQLGETFPTLSCQDKFLIEVTDGLGNVDSDVNSAETAVNDLADDGVSTVAVGFGIDDASQIQKVAEVANARGKESDTDGLFPLHDEVNGTGAPFLAYNQQELLEALTSVSRKIENRFTGSAPAPTTSADDEDLLMVLIAEFGSASWTGDLTAIEYDPLSGAATGVAWQASQELPATRNTWTVDTDPTSATYSQKVAYTDATLVNDNYLCKGIGDIINSAPVIVKAPNFYYPFDGYHQFFSAQQDRDPMVYIGSNDGMLHAFSLTDKTDGSGNVTVPGGRERWAFVPPSLLDKLDMAGTDPTRDMCSQDYCHQYYVDGSPQAADIYLADADAWKTILVTGMREGGDAYFALDVTDSLPMQNSTTVGADFRWEFTDGELGQTWGDASIDRVLDISAGAPADATWATFFGSGYADSPIDQASKEAYVYGVGAWDKTPLWSGGAGGTTSRIKLAGGTLTDDATSGVLTVAYNDFNYADASASDPYLNWRSNLLYTGNLYGAMYRVSKIGKGQEPQVSLLYDSGNTDHRQAIRARADYAFGEVPMTYWIYFGTGRYETQADKQNLHRQYFFGLLETPDGYPDNIANNRDADGELVYSTTYTKPADLETVTIDPATTNKLPSPAVAGTPQLVVLDAVTQTATVGSQARTFKVIEGQNENHEPWVVRLDNQTSGLLGSERVIEKPLVVGKVVFFTSFIPSSDPCAGSGSSYLYAINFETGKPPETPVFDLNGDGYYDDQDKIPGDANGDGIVEDDEKVTPAAMGLGAGQASQVVYEDNIVFVSMTDQDDDDEDPFNAEKVNIDMGNLRIDSWKDSSLNP
jgi:hypothetical protein